MFPSFIASNDHILIQPLRLLPPSVRDPIVAVATQLNVDLGMAISAVLSGMAGSEQGLYLVEDPNGEKQQLSLFFWVLAGPTAGKTRTHKLVHAEHNNQDQLRYDAYKKAKSDGGGARLRDIILEDITARGLIEALEGNREATSVSSHEGQRVMESYLMRKLDIVNSAWDGERLPLHRAKGERVVACNPSLNMLIMTQPEMFKQFIDRDKGKAQAIGYWPRCLMMQVETGVPSLQLPYIPPADAMPIYYQRVTEMLTSALAKREAGTFDPEIITFSPDACELWRQLSAEQIVLTNTQYWHMSEAARRAMQNVARLAGVIHCFSGVGGGISGPTLLAAWHIVQWYLGQFATLFPPAPWPLLPAPKPTTHEKRQRRVAEDAATILFQFDLHLESSTWRFF